MSGILEQLQELLKNQQNQIDEWFLDKFSKSKAFIYNSVDIRFSGEKIAPVDTNIFPAGFNNLSDDAVTRAIDEIKENYQDKKILILTEFHTRNLRYLENVNIIKKIFHDSGNQVELGSFADELTESLNLEDFSGQPLTIHPIQRKDDKIFVANDFYADVIVVNNDLTAGSPDILKNLEQDVVPPTGMGWYRRKKILSF